jgi:streptogramin lyase
MSVAAFHGSPAARWLPARPLAIDVRGVLWLSDFGGGRVLSFDPATGDIAEFCVTRS